MTIIKVKSPNLSNCLNGCQGFDHSLFQSSIQIKVDEIMSTRIGVIHDDNSLGFYMLRVLDDGFTSVKLV